MKKIISAFLIALIAAGAFIYFGLSYANHELAKNIEKAINLNQKDRTEHIAFCEENGIEEKHPVCQSGMPLKLDVVYSKDTILPILGIFSATVFMVVFFATYGTYKIGNLCEKKLNKINNS